jgi:hypothetical protein
MTAVVVADLVWVFFDYQLWQHQNQEFMMPIVRRFARPSTSSR